MKNKIQALKKHLINEEGYDIRAVQNVKPSKYNKNIFEINSIAFYIFNDHKKAEELAIKMCNDTWNACYDWSQIPDFLMNYIDLDKASIDAVNIDGIGRFLSSYDGNEYEVDYRGHNYFIYRII